MTPAAVPASAPITVLLDASNEERTRTPGAELPGQFEHVRGSDATAAAAIVFGMAAVVMLLVCLVAAAGFIVIAQRRSRQLGLLAAVGATNKHLRLVMLANGVLVGVSAAAIGSVTALAAWFVARPALETSLGHRIDGASIPPGLVLTGIVLAIVTATAAAWWPARSVARLSVTEALSARPAAPKPAHRSVVVAVVAAALGFAGVYFGVDVNADKSNVVLLLAGILALVVAIVFASPIMLRALARFASRLPFAIRLALRDLGRYQAHAGAAVAAISLGLAISVAIVGIASASEPKESDANLSDRQVLVRTGAVDPGVPLLSATDAARLDTMASELAAGLDHATVLPLDFAVDSGPRAGRSPARRGVRTADARSAGGIAHDPRRRPALRRDAGPGRAARCRSLLDRLEHRPRHAAGRRALHREHRHPADSDPGARHRTHRAAAVLEYAEEPHHGGRRRRATDYRATRGGWLIESASAADRRTTDNRP